MWHLRTWLSGGLGGTRLTVDLNDLKGLFQSNQFYDLMILKYYLHFINREKNTVIKHKVLMKQVFWEKHTVP